jgi:predicted phosphodiesterase
MRLAVFSDIHGNLGAFQAALADFETHGGADRIWFLGDFAAMGSRPAECVRLVREMVAAAEADEAKKGTIRCIRGNTDRYLTTGERPRQDPITEAEQYPRAVKGLAALHDGLMWGTAQLPFEEYEFLAKLGTDIEQYVDGFGNIVGYHGTPGDDEGRLLSPDTDEETASDMLLDREGRLGIGGHIHVQMDRMLRNGWRAINVGSVGNSFDQPGFAQYGYFTFANGGMTAELRSVPYDLEAAVADLKAVDFPANALRIVESRLRQAR